jgi:hypothetical protein
LKFVFFVEGSAEQALAEWLRRWLDARLPRRIGVQVVRFQGWSDYYDKISKRVHLHLSAAASRDVIAVFGLLDLYAPTFIPEGIEAVADRYRWAKEHLEQRVGHHAFRQHFAVHETEAWLLAEPRNLPEPIRKALPKRCAQPETVDFDEPPAKLLNRLYREKLRRPFRKVIDGADLFSKLDPERVHQTCPFARQLLDEMLSLASD